MISVTKISLVIYFFMFLQFFLSCGLPYAFVEVPQTLRREPRQVLSISKIIFFRVSTLVNSDGG